MTDFLTNHIIQSLDLSEHYSIIHYGIQSFLEETTTLLIALSCVFLCFGNITCVIVFSIAFAMLRQYAGGIHAATHSGCIIATTSMFCISMFMASYVKHGVLLTTAIISSLCIWLLSPIEMPNRRSNLSQMLYNQHKSRHLLILYWFTILSCYHTQTSIMLLIVIIMISILQFLCLLSFSDKSVFERFPRRIYSQARTLFPILIVTFCTVICQNTVQCTSKSWIYENDIPLDIQHTFDNL